MSVKNWDLRKWGYDNPGAESVGFLGAFAKLRKATISFDCLSVSPSVRIEKLGSHWTDFHEI
jgi:hypothetical protein